MGVDFPARYPLFKLLPGARFHAPRRKNFDWAASIQLGMQLVEAGGLLIRRSKRSQLGILIVAREEC